MWYESLYNSIYIYEIGISSLGKVMGLKGKTLNSKPEGCCSENQWHSFAPFLLSTHPKTLDGFIQVFTTINKSSIKFIYKALA